LFRFGTGDILGFPKEITDSYAPKARLHIAHGIPNAWGEEDVENFLGRQDWKQIRCLFLSSFLLRSEVGLVQCVRKAFLALEKG